jgi:hypothetical protein
MSVAAKIKSPPGYGVLVPLDPRRHAGLAVADIEDYRLCAHINAVFVSAVEMPRASLDFPLAFTREPDLGEYSPVAIFALHQKENLFVDVAGRWRPQTYVPAHVRRHPFCIAHIQSSDGRAARNLVCVQEDRLRPSSRPYFDRHGKVTEHWQSVLRQLEAIENERQRTRVLVRRLDALGLLMPFDAVAVVRGGGVRARPHDAAPRRIALGPRAPQLSRQFRQTARYDADCEEELDAARTAGLG